MHAFKDHQRFQSGWPPQALTRAAERCLSGRGPRAVSGLPRLSQGPPSSGRGSRPRRLGHSASRTYWFAPVQNIRRPTMAAAPDIPGVIFFWSCTIAVVTLEPDDAPHQHDLGCKQRTVSEEATTCLGRVEVGRQQQREGSAVIADVGETGFDEPFEQNAGPATLWWVGDNGIKLLGENGGGKIRNLIERVAAVLDIVAEHTRGACALSTSAMWPAPAAGPRTFRPRISIWASNPCMTHGCRVG